MTRKDLVESGHDNVIVFENPSYDGCIIGISTDDRAVYSLAKMVLWYVEENDGVDCEVALEYIEYNTIRSLPYIKNGPIILDDL